MEQANSIENYNEILKRYQGIPELYYRGQSEEYKAMPPSIARRVGYAVNESKIYQEAISLGAVELEGLTSPLEKLSKLQHYGIPTRLVDVTIDPLIALYFAVEDVDSKFPGNVYIYDLKGYAADSTEIKVLSILPTIENLSSDNIASKYQKQFNEVITHDEVRRIVNSPVILQYSNALQKSNPRLHNQKGTFLICGNELSGDTITGKLKSLDTYAPTLVIRIPYEYKRAIKQELDNRYKINRMSIYPELPSVAKYIEAKYGKEDEKLEKAYSIVEEKDISTGVAKRISVILVLNKPHTIEQIKGISIEVMKQYQKSQDVVWLYVARSGDDYIMTNWVLSGQWISPSLNARFRPMTLKIEENGYYWEYNKSYSIMADYYEKNVFEEDVELYQKHMHEWELFLSVFTHLLNMLINCSWDEFVKETIGNEKQIKNICDRLSNCGYSHSKEFDNFLGKIHGIVGIVDNIRFLIRNEKISDAVKQNMIRKDFNKVSSEIEKINREFPQWKTRLGIAE